MAAFTEAYINTKTLALIVGLSWKVCTLTKNILFCVRKWMRNAPPEPCCYTLLFDWIWPQRLVMGRKNFPLSLFDHVWESRAAWTAVGRLFQPCAINRHAGNKHVHLPFISVLLLQHRQNRITTTGPPKARVSAHQATSLYSLSTNEEDAVSVTASVLNISWGYGVLNVNNIEEQKVHEDH